MATVQVDHAAIRAFLEGAEVRADLHERAIRVTQSAARRARAIAHHPNGAADHWAQAMDHEPGIDAEGAHEDVSWRHGTGAGESWQGHFLLFGTSQPNHPPHLDVLLGAIDEA